MITAEDAQALGIGLGLSTADLQAIIDREDTELVRRFGNPGGSRTEMVQGGGQSLFLRRAISSVASISEYYYLGDTATALTTTEYYVWGDEGRIERISTARKWGAVASVTYTPVDDSNLREMVLYELARIGSEEAMAGGESVSGLGFSVGASNGNSPSSSQRSMQYARLGWLDR